LAEIALRSGDYGVCYDWAKSHMISRKIDSKSCDGEGLVGGYGILLGLVVANYAESLQEGLLENPIHEINFQSEFNVNTSVKGYDVGIDEQTSVRTIVFTDSDTLSRKHFYKNPHDGQVVLVLGGGNQAFLALTDVLYHMFVEGRVAIIKHHPLQTAGARCLEHILDPVIRRGFALSLPPDLDIESTRNILYSPLINVVHLTGGVKTHDILVWGSDVTEASHRRERGEPLLQCMHSELGSVTPYIVIPSSGESNEWSDNKIALYARYAAAALADNCSCNCIALKVIILPANELGNKFENEFKKCLSKTKIEPAWYPGMTDRYNKWIKSIERCGSTVDYFECARKDVGSSINDICLPFAVANVGTISSSDIDNIEKRYCDLDWAREEAFAPVVSIVKIEITNNDTAAYAADAFRFANNCLWGNLACAVFCPPTSQHLVVKSACDGELMFGSIVINAPTQLGYQLRGYWGGPTHAHNSITNPQSGAGGTVGNALMINNARNGLCIRGWNEKQIPDLPEVGPVTSKILTRFLVKGWSALNPFS
jgi:hypothetical protein